MSAQIFSPAWYRVAELSPRLRRHVEVVRHRYRDRSWFLLRDPVSGRHFRLNEAAWSLVGRFDGRRTLRELWRQVCEALGDAAPTQDEVIRLLGQLHQADLVQMPRAPELPELQRRRHRLRRGRALQYLRSPLSLKLPLWDPDAFLRRTLPLVRPLFTRWGLLAWLCLVGFAGLLAAQHFDQLAQALDDRLFSARGLLLLALVYVPVKLLHELAHGWAVRRWGGEVHEMGLMFMVFMPVPYVDASAATAFESKRRRMAVAAAGILAETTLAALALLFWLQAEPGLARAAAYQVMLIGAVSTLLINGNPLLKFDGYYVLADWLEIPNLAKRANGFVVWLVRRHLLGERDAEPVLQAPGEAPWLLGYAVLAFLYRVALVAGILYFVAGQFFAVGLLLALWAALGTLLLPGIARLWRFQRRLAAGRRRLRCLALLLGGLALGWLLLAWLPLPYNLMAQGVAQAPEAALVRLPEPCLVEQVVAAPGATVRRGELLLRCASPELERRVAVAEARLALAEARLEEAGADPVARALAEQEQGYARSELERWQRRRASLAVRAPRAGRVAVPEAADLPGRLLPRGQVVAQVLQPGELTVRAFVAQADWERLRERDFRVQARLAADLSTVIPARLLRVVPGATRELPSPVLGSRGGGPWPELPASGEDDDSGRVRTLKPGFWLDFALEAPLLRHPEERVHLRFELPPEPLLGRLRRLLHELFLGHVRV